MECALAPDRLMKHQRGHPGAARLLARIKDDKGELGTAQEVGRGQRRLPTANDDYVEIPCTCLHLATPVTFALLQAHERATTCLGSDMEIKAASRTNPLDTHRHASNPYAWNTQPDSSVPIKRPMAFVM